MRTSPSRARLLPLVSALSGAALAVSLLGAAPATADPTDPVPPVAPVAPVAPDAPDPAPATPVEAPIDPVAAQEALAQAESFAGGELAPELRERARRSSALGRLLGRAATPEHSRVDGTLVLRDLFRLADGLSGADQRRARMLLARPTDQGADPYGDGYSGTSRRTCSPDVCVHWTPTGADAPTNRAWVERTLAVLDKVWSTEVDRFGYRQPLPDRGKGGDNRFDVYLADLGNTGAYGYCTPEDKAPGNRFTASGYCVLDNDFSPQQYAGTPAGKSLRVTAAHEFFHAVQFAYDFGEDPWFMESTAVWMEEQVMGGINDNRQYLPYGQLADPGNPLDRFDASGFSQYGNWVWWEYLSQRYGTSVVKKIWVAAAAGGGSRDAYSTEAVRRVLAPLGGFPAVFARYAAATTDASRTFMEGGRWPAAASAGAQQVSASNPRARTSASVDHMASSSWVYRADPASVAGRGWMLKVAVRGPRATLSPAVAVRVTKTNGTVVERPLRLGARGTGRTIVPFGAKGVSQVTVTLANASTRFRCWKGSFAYSCQGQPRDNNAPFQLRVKAFKR
ncbi:MAG: DUF6055 domain-containing protein [Nocardioides sp.]|nr:DUF6055 domain-containing protein [Nocardioides sp.]